MLEFKKRVMIDVETMSTRSNAAPVTIAAVVFELETGRIHKSFTANVNWMELYDNSGRFHCCPETAKWWTKNGGVPTENIMPLKHALELLQEFFRRLAEDIEVWAKSPAFDCVVIKNALLHCNMPVPWKFKNERCVRTYCHAVDMTDKYLATHVAVEDCLHQIRVVHNAYKSGYKIEEGEKMVRIAIRDGASRDKRNVALRAALANYLVRELNMVQEEAAAILNKNRTSAYHMLAMYDRDMYTKHKNMLWADKMIREVMTGATNLMEAYTRAERATLLYEAANREFDLRNKGKEGRK